MRDFKFQPIKRLKGLFQRDQLSMTPSDLGISAEGDAAVPLKEGEYRLLILAQQQGPWPSLGCVSASPGATSFDERVPLLKGPDDPLVSVVQTLIEVADARSRRQRTSLLLNRLETVDGVAAVPLLSSLRSRSDWAAADARTLPALTRLIVDRSTAVQRCCTRACSAMCSRTPNTAPRPETA